MLFWTIQTAIASFIFIFLVHYLINFFKSTLTVPKIKDLVNTPTQKYENIYKIISHSKNNNNKSNQPDKKNNGQYDIADLLPTITNSTNVASSTPIDKNNMKNELKHFLKSQMNNSSSSAITELIGTTDLGKSSTGISFSEF
jgi:hypothetical protein